MTAPRHPYRSISLVLALLLTSASAIDLTGQTQTATLVVQEKYLDFAQDTAFATSFMLASASVICIVIVSLLRPKEHR